MNTCKHSTQTDAGYALITVVVFTGITLTVLAGAMRWTSTTANLTDRNNQLYETIYAAEAATEKVVSQITQDFKKGDQAEVYSKLGNYRSMIPTASENAFWANYNFGDGAGTKYKTTVENINAWGFVPLQSQYAGLNGMAATYRVQSNAQRYNSRFPGITACVIQDVQIATIPIFQFAIFYGMDMEISCGQPFNITGRVHSNGELYVCPDNALNFWTDVTAVGNISFRRAPGDSRGAPSGSATYKADHDSRTASLNLPVGTNNTPDAVRRILEVPPSGEAANSLMGKQRFYNKADLIVKITDNISTNFTFSSNKVGSVWNITTNSILSTNILLSGKSGAADNFATTVSSNLLKTFINVASNSSANSFQDWREGKTVLPIDIDVAKLRTNNAVFSALGNNVNLLYVDDARRYSVNTNTQLGAVRMINGVTLPTNGLTVATSKPLYVKGHYNAPNSSHRGTTNTSSTLPASLMGDAVTVLSEDWSDANSTLSVGNRKAADTTVNAAFLAGIVPTIKYNVYSGGAENFPRFLEDWNYDGTKKTFTYNGSMVVLFPSQYATNPWGMSNVYDPPARNWAFDLNFMDANKLPPGTPSLSALIRGKWQIAQPTVPH